MDRIVLRAFDREIVDQGRRLVFRKRASGTFLLALMIGAVAAGFYAVGQWKHSGGEPSGAIGSLLSGGAGLLAIVGGITLLSAVYLLLLPSRCVFAQTDEIARDIVVRGRRISLGEIRQFSFTALHNGMHALCVETAAGETLPLWVATASQWDVLRQLAVQMSALCGPGEGAVVAPPALDIAAGPTAFEQRFQSQVIVAIGVLWTLGGIFFFRGLSFTSWLTPDGPRVPVWCAGLLILVYGLVDWLKSRRP